MITSADGTTIAHRTTGSGPGVLVIPGPMETAADFQELADALALGFTVHAVLAATGAQRLFGVSSGAVIALEAAALRLPGITHVTGPQAAVTIAKGLGFGPRWLRVMLLPDAEKVLVENAHHFTTSENPRHLVPALKDFLQAPVP